MNRTVCLIAALVAGAFWLPTGIRAEVESAPSGALWGAPR
jgi:hypothetical protein